MKKIARLFLLLLFLSWMSQSVSHIHGIDVEHDSKCNIGFVLSNTDHLLLTPSTEYLFLPFTYELVAYESRSYTQYREAFTRQRAPPFLLA